MSTQKKHHTKNTNNKKHNKKTKKNKAPQKNDFFYSVNHAWMKRVKNQNRFLSLDRKTMHELFHVVKSFTKINTPEARQVTAVYNAVLHVKNEEVIPWLLSFLCQCLFLLFNSSGLHWTVLNFFVSFTYNGVPSVHFSSHTYSVLSFS